MSGSTTLMLGKKPVKYDSRTLRLRNYVSEGRLPPIPDQVNWSAKVRNFPMYDNDKVGNCAIAGPAHQIQVWTANDSTEIIPTLEQVMSGYSIVGGYSPLDPSSDNGCYLLDVMRQWRNIGLCNNRIGAYALVEPTNHALTCEGIYLFGGLCVGLALPLAAQDMTVWEAPGRFHRHRQWAKGSWGGHCVQVVDYDSRHLTCVTWGALKRMSWEFYEAYCDEAYVAISSSWLGKDSKAPNGFDAWALYQDLQLVRE